MKSLINKNDCIPGPTLGMRKTYLVRAIKDGTKKAVIWRHRALKLEKELIMKRVPLLSLLVLPLAASLSGCSGDSAINEVVKARPVFVQPLAVSGDVERKGFNGVTQSVISADISFRVPGTVEKVLVVVGQVVEVGQVLAQLDAHDYEVVVIELEARQQEAQAAQTFYQAEYDRIKQASKNQAVAEVNLERALSNLAKSQASLKVVEQNLIKARDAVRYTVLKAPFDGVVGDVGIEDFEHILPAVPVMELHQQDFLETIVDVPENQLHRFKKGQQANIKWFGSNSNHPATLVEISTVPHPIKQTYDVVFAFNEEARDILPGKSVTVDVSLEITETRDFCVPFSAVLQEGVDNYIYLTSEQDRKVTRKQVKVERIADNELCISGELSPEQLIVTAGAHYLNDGQIVGTLLKNQ